MNNHIVTPHVAVEHLTNVAIIHGQLGHGGSERQLFMLLQQCDRRRWRPHLFISGELGVWEPRIRDLDIPVTLLTGNPLQKMRQFRRLCRATSIRWLLSWSSYTNVYALALLGMNVPCIGSFRNANFSDLPTRGRRVWQWLSLAGVSSIICNSRETLAALQKIVSSRKQLLYVPNGVQPLTDMPELRARWRSRLQLKDDAILVVGVGRLTAQKNFGRFIEAMALANQQMPVHAVIAGPDMGLKAALEEQIRTAGLTSERIRLLGPVDDARELICAADIFLLSSDYEGMPNVTLEAMASGVPCVSTPVNGIRELIESGLNGMVTEPSAAALAQAVLRLGQDASARRTMGKYAQERILEKFASAKVYQSVWELCN